MVFYSASLYVWLYVSSSPIANIEEAALNTRLSKTSDFGFGCSADGNLIIHEKIFETLMRAVYEVGGKGYSCGIYVV